MEVLIQSETRLTVKNFEDFRIGIVAEINLAVKKQPTVAAGCFFDEGYISKYRKNSCG